jgi:hypothetical protein
LRTRTQHAGVALAALDYEIVALAALGPDGRGAPDVAGEFRDIHLRDDGEVFRYVAGYLALESVHAGAGLLVLSHGRATARLVAEGNESVSVRFEGSATVGSGRIVLPGAGLGLVPRGPWTLEGGDLRLGAPGEPARALLVHGPARTKIEARMALADSLYTVGGRRG